VTTAVIINPILQNTSTIELSLRRIERRKRRIYKMRRIRRIEGIK
jgi:hypothetical protein